jgi:integrase
MKKTNFTANGQSYYRTTATIGHDADGKPIRKQFYGSSKKDATDKRDEYLCEIKKGLSFGYDKALFGDVLDTWMTEVLKPSVSVSTYRRYTTEYTARLKSCELSSVKLKDIKSINIQSLYNALLKDNTIETVHFTHRLIRMFFNYCVKAEIIGRNPIAAVELPKRRKSEKNKALSRESVDIIVAAAKGNIAYFIYVFAVFTGLRQGEVLALTHADIDVKNDVISVNKSLSRILIAGEYRDVVTPTKTEGSIREIPLLPEVKALLLEHIVSEKKKHLRLGIPFKNDRPLFTSSTGEYLIGSAVYRSLNNMLGKIGVEKTTFHSLRHTFCTLLAENGVPLKTASVLMGHSTIAMTAEIYTHVNNKELKKGIEKLSVLFQ